MTKQMFSVAAPEAPALFSLALVDHPEATTDSTIRRLKVFKAGTFADSMGRVRTWTQADLESMVRNYATLGSSVLPNIPVRLDHTESVRHVVGWFRGLYTDPAEPGFLFADIEFTEPDAKAKYDRRTLLNRSIEIGRYETNTGEKYEPVVLGLAWVDLPAVEGLFRSPNAAPAAGDPSPAPGTANHQGAAMTTPDPAPGTPPPADPAPTPPAPGTPPPADPALATHRAGATQTHTFKVNGLDEMDFGKVQTHITVLETFRKDAIETGRSDFVKKLASDNKIANPQIEPMTGMVLTMTDAQWAQFQSSYATAPVVPGLGAAVSTGTGGTPPAAGGTDLTPLEVAKEVVANHKRRGASIEEIAATNSGKTVIAAGIALETIN